MRRCCRAVCEDLDSHSLGACDGWLSQARTLKSMQEVPVTERSLCLSISDVPGRPSRWCSYSHPSYSRNAPMECVRKCLRPDLPYPLRQNDHPWTHERLTTRLVLRVERGVHYDWPTSTSPLVSKLGLNRHRPYRALLNGFQPAGLMLSSMNVRRNTVVARSFHGRPRKHFSLVETVAFASGDCKSLFNG